MANSAGPCEDESAQLANVTAGPVTARALSASTNVTPNNPSTTPPAVGDSGVADAQVAFAGIAVGPGIQADVLHSTATVRCGRFHPTLTSSSSITTVRLGGTAIAVTQQQAISLGPLGFLRLNWQVQEPGKVTRRALWVDLAPFGTATTGNPAGPDVIVSEAIADYTGNPCIPTEQRRPQCSDGIDNDGDGLVDFGPNPFHNESPATGCDSPTDDDERAPAARPQCSDGIDNDGDRHVDFGTNPGSDGSDLQCSSPDDNDESR